MKSFTLQGVIAATPRQVFAVLADVDQAKEWMPDLQEIRDVSGPLSVGAHWTETRLPPGRKKPMTSQIQVTEFAPGVAFAIRVIDKRVDLRFRFGLEPTSGGTKVTYDAEGGLRGLAAPFSGMLMRMVEKSDQDLLDRLAAQVAKGAGKGKAAAKAPAKKASKPKGASKKAK